MVLFSAQQLFADGAITVLLMRLRKWILVMQHSWHH